MESGWRGGEGGSGGHLSYVATMREREREREEGRKEKKDKRRGKLLLITNFAPGGHTVSTLSVQPTCLGSWL